MGSEAPSVRQSQPEVIYASETEGSTARDRITAEKSIQSSSLRLSKLCGVKMLGGCYREELGPGTRQENKPKQYSEPRWPGSEAPSVRQLRPDVIDAWRTFYSPTSKRRAERPGVRMPSSACRSTDTRSRGANTAQTICQPVAHLSPFSWPKRTGRCTSEQRHRNASCDFQCPVHPAWIPVQPAWIPVQPAQIPFSQRGFPFSQRRFRSASAASRSASAASRSTSASAASRSASPQRPVQLAQRPGNFAIFPRIRPHSQESGENPGNPARNPDCGL
jgi:hypothetical protein